MKTVFLILLSLLVISIVFDIYLIFPFASLLEMSSKFFAILICFGLYFLYEKKHTSS